MTMLFGFSKKLCWVIPMSWVTLTTGCKTTDNVSMKTKPTPNEIQLIIDVCLNFADQVPRLVAYAKGLEIERDGLQFENASLRQELFTLETKLHQIAVMKNPGSEN